jgi:hypothetical protein
VRGIAAGGLSSDRSRACDPRIAIVTADRSGGDVVVAPRRGPTGRRSGPGRPTVLLAAIAVVVVVAFALLAVGSTGNPGHTAVPDGPAVSGLYGPGIGMDSLNNTIVGGPDGTMASYRFRASTSAGLSSIRVYVMGPTHAGYGAGTGGTWEVTVQPDDGTSRHGPTGTVLATASLQPTEVFPVVSWSSPPSLVAGQLYHVVFTNVDPDPAANYASVNGIFTYQPTTPRQPAFSDADWAQLTNAGSSGWSESESTVPIMQLSYTDGVTDGEGYMEVWIRSAKTISGPAQAREAFTVSGPDRAVGELGVRLMRISGGSPLEVRLEGADGTPVEEGTIAASTIPVGAPGDHGGLGHATWETWTLSTPRILRSGSSYQVVLSTAADTSYSIFVIMQGEPWGFDPATYFADGHAQYTTGGGWGPFTQDGGGALDQGDLQFYFR